MEVRFLLHAAGIRHDDAGVVQQLAHVEISKRLRHNGAGIADVQAGARRRLRRSWMNRKDNRLVLGGIANEIQHTPQHLRVVGVARSVHGRNRVSIGGE